MDFKYEEYSLENPSLRCFVIYNAEGDTRLVIELTNEEGAHTIALDHAAASKLNDFILDFLYQLDLYEQD